MEKGREDRCAGVTLTPNNSRPKTPSLEAKKGSIGAKGLDVFLKPASLSFLPPHSSEVSFQKNSHFIINTTKKTPLHLPLFPFTHRVPASESSSVNKLGMLGAGKSSPSIY